MTGAAGRAGWTASKVSSPFPVTRGTGSSGARSLPARPRATREPY